MAVPGAMPVTTGAVVGVVDPAGMVTVAGEIETTPELLLDRATVTPPVPAGADNVTWKGADWPRPTVTPEGSEMLPPLCTVTVAVALVTLGAVLDAVMVVVPTLSPVTGTLTEVAPCEMVTLAGMLSTPDVLVLRLIVNADGAAADKFKIRFWVADPAIVIDEGLKLSAAPTTTIWTALL